MSVRAASSVKGYSSELDQGSVRSKPPSMLQRLEAMFRQLSLKPTVAKSHKFQNSVIPLEEKQFTASFEDLYKTLSDLNDPIVFGGMPPIEDRSALIQMAQSVASRRENRISSTHKILKNLSFQPVEVNFLNDCYSIEIPDWWCQNCLSKQLRWLARSDSIHPKGKILTWEFLPDWSHDWPDKGRVCRLIKSFFRQIGPHQALVTDELPKASEHFTMDAGEFCLEYAMMAEFFDVPDAIKHLSNAFRKIKVLPKNLGRYWQSANYLSDLTLTTRLFRETVLLQKKLTQKQKKSVESAMASLFNMRSELQEISLPCQKLPTWMYELLQGKEVMTSRMKIEKRMSTPLSQFNWLSHSVKRLEVNADIDWTSISFFKNLQVLMISGFGVSLTDCSVLRDCKLLEEVSFQDCIWLQGGIEALALLPKLKKLSLQGSMILHLGPLARCRELRELSLKDCAYLVDGWEVLSSLKDLERLDLSSTSIKSLIDLRPLKSLKSLTLKDCQYIQSLRSLQYCIELVELSLANCRGIERGWSVMSLFTELEVLDLSGTSIGSLNPLRPLIKLRRLILDWCESIKDLEPLAGCKELRELSLSGCFRLSEGWTILSLFTHLERLDLCNTDIEDLSILAPLSELKILVLKECVNVTKGFETIGKLKKLEFINMRALPLKNLDCLKGLDDLKEIWVSESLLKSQESKEIIASLRNLRIINGKYL